MYVSSSSLAVRKVRLSPSGLTAAAFSAGEVNEWDLEFDRSQRILFNDDFFPTGCVAYSRDGRRLAIGGGPQRGKNEIVISSLKSREGKLRQFAAHSETITQLRFAPNGRNVISSSRDGMVIGWDTVSELAEFKIAVGSAINDFDVSSEDRLLTADDQGRVRLWNYASNEE